MLFCRIDIHYIYIYNFDVVVSAVTTGEFFCVAILL